ncbi:hypothetical protein [Kitasatospora azatica]|uniref:hypothetical protein n=1 Tax=Kitasatospora azatica TaxID=58347 RepID=UPI000AA702E4|nr:hypothetical protein [Kitasatospora azatica]
MTANDSCWDSILPSGLSAGSSEEALDCAGGLYLTELAICSTTLNGHLGISARCVD